MLIAAVTKIKAEMNESNSKYIQITGEFLLQHIERFPEDACHILDENKSIGASLTEMAIAAGSDGVMSDDEVFNFILSYFNIDAIVAPISVPLTMRKNAKSTTFDLKMKDIF